MKDTQYTPEQLIALCEEAKADYTQEIAECENKIIDNNASIGRLAQGISSFNTQINDFKADTAKTTDEIATLYTQIDMQNDIIDNYLHSLK